MPNDLFAEVKKQLVDGSDVDTKAIDKIDEIAGALHAQLHINCYLSPTQLAEKFGVLNVDTPAEPPEKGGAIADREVAAVAKKDPAPPPKRKSTGGWLLLGLLLLTIVGAVALIATGGINISDIERRLGRLLQQ